MQHGHKNYGVNCAQEVLDGRELTDFYDIRMAVFRQITPDTQGVICDFGKSRFTEMVDAEKKRRNCTLNRFLFVSLHP